ncbi:pyridoxamine 5'-phosphate oxidase family protein [Desmospora profundinema]|uniref:Pyridoxine 5'-phosphate oxidase superfamily flavin-nucleotide-binding protein n=1 Tax=Desmospora profundinema TaxID=1571184 RepID=A0ABU1IK74_9BACL|nr:pyridoxamine 5'-phosphate oxidase family protein [Desmospora profundinema]MDR6225185.1 putative pyridoxine 5'-phosphate oxidase superfamily flavin-nucleotide-binding protein [Desmospora profundinema]
MDWNDSPQRIIGGLRRLKRKVTNRILPSPPTQTEAERKSPLPGSTGEHLLQKQYGTDKRALAFYNHQMMDRLNDVMIDYIARQEMVFLSTSDGNGECDSSFRAGPPGFVRIINDRQLMYPEYRGNGVMASLGNIVENPHIGMLFIDFFQTAVGLHVNGKASILENSELLIQPDLPDVIREDILTEDGRKPERWVLVDVEEAYIHCSKHIPLLRKLDREIDWGTDDAAKKGGDHFQVKNESRPWKNTHS